MMPGSAEVRTATFAQLAPQLAARGWSPIPCDGKRPDIAGKGWNAWNRDVPGPSVISRWSRLHPGANVGLAVGRTTVAIDVDVLDERLATELAAAADSILGRTPLVRVGRAPKWLRVYRGRARHEKRHPVEVFNGAGQFVAYGIHPDTGAAYHWQTLDPTEIIPSDPRIPEIDQAKVDVFLARAEKILGTRLTGRAAREPGRQAAPAGSWRDGLLGRAFELAGLVRAPVADDRVAVTCPWQQEHTEQNGSVTECVVFAPAAGQQIGWLNCMHAHCYGRRQPGDVLAKLPPGAVAQARAELGLVDDAARAVEWDDPVPLDEPVGLPTAPLDTLPRWLGDMVEATATTYQVDPAFPALYALAIVSGALAGKFTVRVRDGWEMPPVLYVAAALPPSEKKSHVIRPLAEPLHAYEREQRAAGEPMRRDALAAVEREKARRDALLAEIKRGSAGKDCRPAAKVDEEHTTAERKVAEAEAAVPHEVRLLTEYATPEALAERMAQNHGRQIIVSDEGAGVIAMPSRYTKGGGADLDLLLKAFDGAPYRPDRITRRAPQVDAALLAIAVGLQPAAIAQAIRENPELDERGLLSRFLILLPKPRAGSREIRPPATPRHVASAYEAGVRALLELPDRFADGRLDPRPLVMSRGADDVLAAFEAEIEPRLAPGGAWEPIARMAGKLAGNAARIAACLHVADYAMAGSCPSEIPAETAERGVRWASACVPHALALADAIAAPPEAEGARRVLAFLARHGAEAVSERDILRATRGAGVLATAEQRDRALRRLEEHGWVQAEPQSKERRRGRPSARWLVHPDLRAHAREPGITETPGQNTQNSAAACAQSNSVRSVHGNDGFDEAAPRAWGEGSSLRGGIL